ncbi:MAG: hypothetical protein GXP04_00470 [Alphaproteobacteria bacterium]|nr:hypothetical protein [Alphaproteobacteria bacterium]
MLLIAAILTIVVSLMHSILGGRRLIAPILRMDNLPIILGSVTNTKLTLRIGWHMTSLLWWGIAAILAIMHYRPESVAQAFLWMVCVVFGISGAAALILSRGAHKSWLLFFPVAAIAGYMAYTG